MKLFQRTLWSFVGVIGLQAALSGAALAAIFGSMQAEDAEREVSAEAANAYESFNAWKLAFWKEINELIEDRALEAAVASSLSSPVRSSEVSHLLARRLSSSAAQAMILRDEAGGVARYLYEPLPGRGFPESGGFRYTRSHPYVELMGSGGDLWFVGKARVAPGVRRPLDIFLLKRIDSELLDHLSYDPMVAIAVMTSDGGPRAAGICTSGSGVSGAMASTLAFASKSPSPPGFTGEAYTYSPRSPGPGGPYAVVSRLTGAVEGPRGEEPVFLRAVLSLSAYSARSAKLQSSLLSVSLVVAAITIVVALVLSGSIASPIRKLSKAMRRIEGGDFGVEVRGVTTGELGELLDGFNGMARKLAADRLEMDDGLSQIVELKERSDGIIESIREGLAVIDAEGRVESANGSFRLLFGEDAGRSGALLGEIEGGLFDRGLLDEAREAMRVGERRGGITRRAADGRSFEVKLYPLASAPRPELARCVVVAEDVSERLEYEERVIQADRLGSVGMLSAGIAHEINNPLSSILANVGNAISESDDPEVVAALRVVEGETHRIARIVRQLLDFSSPRRAGAEPGAPKPRCDANEVARELVKLVGYPLRSEGRVEFVLSLDPDCPEAAMGADELKQVLLNLLKNAVQAVEGRGRVGVATRVSPGGLELSVADDGPSIPDEILGRIFDPFFTTKTGPSVPSGAEAGLGLGLSVAYGIVAKRGGSIRAVNGAGGGVAFVVALPAAEGGGV